MFNLDETIEDMDVGVSAIAEVPFYKIFPEKHIAHLTAVDGDAR